MQLLTLDPTLPPIEIRGLTDRSQEVRPGDLFLALAGQRTHGLKFAREVEARGAVAVLYDPKNAPSILTQIPQIPYAELTRRVGELAARFYGEPSQRLELIGITGTNGKTSCAYFLAQLWQGGYIGTLGWGGISPTSWDRFQPTDHTTPPPIELQKILARMRDLGFRRVALEVSSHALDQHRLAGCRLKVALWTNLSRDHLDYHESFDHYAAAKQRLVAWPGLEGVVLNADDPWFPTFQDKASQSSARVVTFSLKPKGGDFWPEAIRLGNQGISFLLHTPAGSVVIETPLFGAIHLPNLLAVAAVSSLLGESLDGLAEKMAALRAPPGRMERFGGGELPLIVIDYAHTPQALERALRAVRPFVEGELWLLFGCGGERDRGKRREMGEIARRLADRVVLTDDNPRREDPARIIAEIQQGIPKPEAVIHDRREAILYILEKASVGDVVLIAGKGHETYQEISGRRVSFSDREVVKAWLRSR